MPYFDRMAEITIAALCAGVLFGCQASPPAPTAADPVGNLPQYAEAQPAIAPAPATPAAPYPPPPKRAEIPPPAPTAHSLWECGHWNWNGARYMWALGGYIERPEPTANWVPGYWDQQGNGWVWVSGHWTS